MCSKRIIGVKRIVKGKRTIRENGEKEAKAKKQRRRK
nr:MAG TPA: hypothetical protein [Caudoviricetes sp.]